MLASRPVGVLGAARAGAPPGRRAGRYIEFCKSTFSNDLSLKGLKIVVDAPRRGLPHRARRVPRTGRRRRHHRRAARRPNINAGVGATAPAALVGGARRTRPTTASRWTATPTGCRWSTRRGRLYNGDELLYVMVVDRLGQQRAVPGVVGTLMTNMAVEVALRQRGVPLRARQGRRPLHAGGAGARGWQLGGEGSGPSAGAGQGTPPATASSARCRSCRRSGAPGRRCRAAAGVTLFPQTLINVRLPRAATGRRTPRCGHAGARDARAGDDGRIPSAPPAPSRCCA